MAKATTKMRWGVEQRLEFIEFHLFWEGGINRSDITDHFGVSVPQASKDLSQYQAMAPRNISYDKSRKRYFKTDVFSPRFLKPDSDRYLAQLQAIADKTLARDDSWISEVPSIDVLPMPHRNVDTDVLRATLGALRDHRSIEIRYQSLSSVRPRATWRWISPHAIAFDGHRWHVRAFCHIDNRFKDFLLPRFMMTRATGAPGAKPSDDLAWTEFVDVVLKPHPGLNEDQKKVIVQDYGMTNERVTIPVRQALLYYFLKRLDLNLYDEKRPSQEQHVVLANPKAIEDALKAEGNLLLSRKTWSPIT